METEIRAMFHARQTEDKLRLEKEHKRLKRATKRLAYLLIYIQDLEVG